MRGYAFYRIALLSTNLRNDYSKALNLHISLLENNYNKDTILFKAEDLYFNFLFYEGKRDEVLFELERLINKFPNFDHLKEIKALCLLKIKNYKIVLEIFNDFIKKDYLSSYYLNFMINHYLFNLHDIDSAKIYGDLYIKKFPDKCNYKLAQINLILKNYRGMEEECKKCSEKQDIFDSIYCNVLFGESYIDRSDFFSLKQLVDNFKYRNKDRELSELKDYEYQSFLRFELIVLLYNSKYDKFKSLVLNGNEFFRPDPILKDEKKYFEFVIGLYKVAHKNDTSGFQSIYDSFLAPAD